MNAVRLSCAVSLLALPLLLSACGNKGPLILPPKNVSQVVMPSGAPPAQDAQQIGDPSDALDQAPKAGDANAETDLDDAADSDPPENTDIP